MIFLNIEITNKNITSISAILAPAGKENIAEIIIPNINVITEIILDVITRVLKLFVIFLAVTAGKTIIVDISSVPMSFIPITIIKAVSIDIRN